MIWSHQKPVRIKIALVGEKNDYKYNCGAKEWNVKASFDLFESEAVAFWNLIDEQLVHLHRQIGSEEAANTEARYNVTHEEQNVFGHNGCHRDISEEKYEKVECVSIYNRR